MEKAENKSKFSNSIHLQKNSPKFMSSSNNSSTNNLQQRISNPSKFCDNERISPIKIKEKEKDKLNNSRNEIDPKLSMIKLRNSEKKPTYTQKKDEEEVKYQNVKEDNFSKTFTIKLSPNKKSFDKNTSLSKAASRDTLSNSPVKQKKMFKSPRDIQDLEIDKESLMQLNRATNQFFSKKVKETIQKSMIFNKPGSGDRKTTGNASLLDETTFSFKSLDRSILKDKDIGIFF